MSATNVSKAKFEKDFDKIISLWPEYVKVGERTFHATGGVSIPTLAKIHDEVESKLVTIGGDMALIGSIDWAIYTAIQNASRMLEIVRPKEISKSAVMSIFVSYESWNLTD